MLVGMTNESELKKKSQKAHIPFPDLLKGYVMEEALRLIGTSEYKEVLWFANDQIMGIDQYRRPTEQIMEFYYLESERKMDPEKLLPGQALSWKMAAYMFAMIFRRERSWQVSWKGSAVQKEDCFQWNMVGEWENMKVPLVIRIFQMQIEHPIPEKAQLMPIMGKDPILYRKYSTENQFSEHLFKIMTTLELINDMESYYIVDNILQNQPISGRHVLEYLHILAQKDPKVLKIRRIKQLEEYENYSYMKGRWEKYLRNRKLEGNQWEDVIGRLIRFVDPVWRALCNDEVFFDDWMPGLERFLG